MACILFSLSYSKKSGKSRDGAILFSAVWGSCLETNKRVCRLNDRPVNENQMMSEECTLLANCFDMDKYGVWAPAYPLLAGKAVQVRMSLGGQDIKLTLEAPWEQTLKCHHLCHF